ncbi:pentapeptide repeat-containing protein [Streptomyces sp. NPDC058758]|uniref:pentapeptide repeat-containing protein n=1 Tax=Streptomyces sp. NPDC058758 TaxID=3346627 RepID=UPI003689CAA6
MSTPPPPTEAPSWPHCTHGADPVTDPVGCRGIHVPGHRACLAHLNDADRTAYLAGLAPGADIDHRETPFTADLLKQLLAALTDPTTRQPRLGTAMFGGAQFFGDAVFSRAQFAGEAVFVGAQFAGEAVFVGAQFTGSAVFLRAQFTGDASFIGVQFAGDAWFTGARFSDDAWFGGAQFSDYARFGGAQFLTSAWLGPVVCAREVDLSNAVFGAPVTLEIAASAVACVRTRWESTATVRVRRAEVDLGYAVLAAPVAVTAHPAPFTTRIALGTETMDESLLTGPDRVRVTSVQGVDAAHLVLTDTDLSDCLFSGAFHLDQLRLEGRTSLAPTPTGWHRKGISPIRWTRRRTLAEEHHWRAQSAGQPLAPAGAPPEPRRWRTGPHHGDPARTPDPDDVAALYRQLRKAFEDGKNEPGAADFYYGECEMRRHDRTGTPKTERRLLWAYWALSGYGLRASRALGWLAAAMLTTILLLMAFGLPASSPKQEATGTVPVGGGKVTFVIDKQDPKNPVKDRFSTKRFDKALSVTLNSVVFRSSGQDLTTAGTYIEMTSRILEPALLALAVLAIRGRIKR